MAFNLTLRKSFLYIFASVGLILIIIAGVNLIDLGLKSFIFTKADNYCYQSYPTPVDKNGVATEPTAQQLAAQKQQCDEQRTSTKQNQASTAVAMLIVGIPLYFYHWVTIRKENQV